MLLSSVVANAGLFEIDVTNIGGLTASQEAIFGTASSFWESHLIGIQAAPNLNLAINASGPFIDGVGGILGSVGPTFFGGSAGFLYALQGIMQFDSADLVNLET
jgi:hypothetical protein